MAESEPESEQKLSAANTQLAESSSANAKITPPARKFQIHLIPERCKGCTYCIEFCPKSVLKVSQKSNSKGYYIPEAAKQEACIGCKLCEMICPDFCIFVEKLSDKKNEANTESK